MTKSVFFKKLPEGRFSGVMVHGLPEKLNLHVRVQADCHMQGMWIFGAVRSDFIHAC